MRTTAPSTLRAHHARLLVVVAAVVMGLLGMHVLTAHGTSPEAMPTPALTATSVSAQNLGAHGPSHDHIQQAALDDAVTSTSKSGPSFPSHEEGAAGGGHGSHSPGSMLMMCLAMLVVALTLLWSVSKTRARVTGLLCLPRLTGTHPALPRSLGLGTGPPPAWQFSVIRC